MKSRCCCCCSASLKCLWLLYKGVSQPAAWAQISLFSNRVTALTVILLVSTLLLEKVHWSNGHLALRFHSSSWSHLIRLCLRSICVSSVFCLSLLFCELNINGCGLVSVFISSVFLRAVFAFRARGDVVCSTSSCQDQPCRGLGLIPCLSLTLQDLMRCGGGNGQTPSLLCNRLLASKQSSLLLSEGLSREVVCTRRQVWNRVTPPLCRREHYCLEGGQFVDQL